MNIELGDYVEITAGPFSSQQGVVQGVYGNEPDSFVRVVTEVCAVLVECKLLKTVIMPVEYHYDDTVWGY